MKITTVLPLRDARYSVVLLHQKHVLLQMQVYHLIVRLKLMQLMQIQQILHVSLNLNVHLLNVVPLFLYHL